MEIEQTWGVDSLEWASRKKYIDFSLEDAALLVAMQRVVEKHADRIVDGFYENVQRQAELLVLIHDAGSTVERLKGAQRRYLLDLFSGNYDDQYCQQRLRIGYVHNRIGLTPKWYLGAYSVYSQLITPLINRKYWYSASLRTKTQLAMNKILSLDSQLAIESYIHSLMQDLRSVTMSKESIDEQVYSYRSAIERISDGDLTARLAVDEERKDDLSLLGGYINTMTNNLSRNSRSIREASNAIQVTLGEVQSAASMQTSSAAEQAAAINETTTTLEQIRVTSNQTLEKAQLLGVAAERTRLKADDGLGGIEKMNNAMAEIKRKVEGIASTILALSQQTHHAGEIVSVVSSLAQQSKMLALNASIEAVKAGDAGKGFGVVAAEVRSMAEQSHQATAQVQSILSNIREATDRAVMVTEAGSKEADDGARLVSQVGTVIHELSRVIDDTTTASQQIVAAVRQGKAGIDQIAHAMDEINHVTRQFVASTRQTSEAAADLGRVAMELDQSVKTYKL